MSGSDPQVQPGVLAHSQVTAHSQDGSSGFQQELNAVTKQLAETGLGPTSPVKVSAAAVALTQVTLAKDNHGDDVEDDHDDFADNLDDDDDGKLHEMHALMGGGAGGIDADQPRHKIFVGGMSWDTTDEAFGELFCKFGTVVEATVMRDRINGASRGFGFVTFREPEAVEKALQEPLVLDKRKIDCKIALPKTGSHGGQHVRKIFVGGISPPTTSDTLREHFAQFGNIVNTVVMIDHGTGRSRGFGFVTFDSEASVAAVLEQPQVVAGKVVECRKAVSKQRQMRLQKESRRQASKGNNSYHNRSGPRPFPHTFYQNPNLASNQPIIPYPMWSQPSPHGPPPMSQMAGGSFQQHNVGDLFQDQQSPSNPMEQLSPTNHTLHHAQARAQARARAQAQQVQHQAQLQQYFTTTNPPNLYSYDQYGQVSPLISPHLASPSHPIHLQSHHEHKLISALDSPSPMYYPYPDLASATLSPPPSALMASMLGESGQHSPAQMQSPREHMHQHQHHGQQRQQQQQQQQQQQARQDNQHQQAGAFRFPPPRDGNQQQWKE
eukprot:gb/GEZN01003550.1/.p1 GENE.gb/GEZN01003550.1/~~gb/GEZN01003550.1/.p1  ORF type:complete len:550 (-),score=93.92 gb/GEZN01003550.1/:334-1983(-)